MRYPRAAAKAAEIATANISDTLVSIPLIATSAYAWPPSPKNAA
jgi:hypothetical protein